MARVEHEPGTGPDLAPTLRDVGLQLEAGIGTPVTTTPYRTEVWRRFRKNKLAVVGLVFIVLLILSATFAPLIAPYGITEVSKPTLYRHPPTGDHWFGTDRIGRDVFSRVLFGARVSLRIGFGASIIAIFIGVVIGAIAGFFGGWLDTFLMRITDVFLAIPYIILAVAIGAVFGRSENSVILILGVTGWLAITRIVRASFLSLKELEYVEAARALGYSRTRIVRKHILPNAMQPIIIYGTIEIGGIILAAAALGYLGIGVQSPSPEWGLQVSEAKGLLSAAPHILFFPGMAIFLTVLAFVFIGDGLRDALDPKMKGRE
jgi:ABC-type dipeptide/oligopeptide/nickel transport system permease subunit